ncbi:hypothetical protein IE53DRAFT_382806 [Violaceomyces palustris]|uniref:Uncharacterized protein n=1 Tax=Violaceomyces palustris TaxID=1673888 RepID=A0ACD0NL37_9BASI|nr:hypothetical protein IE53DRAFT_382806 [Violaceomyces palustris]
MSNLKKLISRSPSNLLIKGNSRPLARSIPKPLRPPALRTSRTWTPPNLGPLPTTTITKTFPHRFESSRTLSTSARVCLSSDPGGKPNDGSHPTVYDDFFNLLEDLDRKEYVNVKSISENTFTLSDGLVVDSPMMIISGLVFLWDPPKLDPANSAPSGWGWEEWNDELWKIFEVIDDRPEILLFGTGKTVLPPPQKVRSYINSLGIQLDVQDSRNACSTYNLLVEEGRKVSLAVLPQVRKPVRRISPEELELEMMS